MNALKTAVSIGMLFVCGMILGCGKSHNHTLTVLPSTARVMANGGQQQFSATLDGNQSAAGWRVNGIPGGNASVGTIDVNGLYSAPQLVPSGGIAISAVAQTDGNTGQAIVTIAPNLNAVSIVMGPMGGSFTVTVPSSPLNGITLTLPQGALKEDTILTLRNLTKFESETIIGLDSSSLPIIFSPPATITVPSHALPRTSSVRRQHALSVTLGTIAHSIVEYLDDVKHF